MPLMARQARSLASSWPLCFNRSGAIPLMATDSARPDSEILCKFQSLRRDTPHGNGGGAALSEFHLRVSIAQARYPSWQHSSFSGCMDIARLFQSLQRDTPPGNRRLTTSVLFAL